ncbi:MAG: hypothetical protein Q7S02_02680 [bacterium]|nr:hypothetical protein [bacterium]
MITEQRVKELMVAALRENVGSLQVEADAVLGDDTVLLGTKSILDSIAFINFTTDVEEKIQAETGTSLVLKLHEIHDCNAGRTMLTIGDMARIVTKIVIRDCAHA